MHAIIYFLIYLSASFVIYWYGVPKKWRSVFLFVASLGFMAQFSIRYTVLFVCNALLIYYAGVVINKDGDNKQMILKAALICLIGELCIFKYSYILIGFLAKLGSQLSPLSESAFAKIALPMGISYIVFRLIHYIIEMYRKNLPEHKFLDFALYIFYFPTFIAGPVERFQRFHPQTAKNDKALEIADINYGLFRIISGIVKKFIVADNLARIIMPPLMAPQEYSTVFVLLAIYGLAIRLYMDFSGYTDMAIGISRLFGYNIMENFNYPFFKENIAEFWRNWHISVYSFIRDYFFFPFFVYRASQLKVYIGIFITMTVFMIWHEMNLPFFILGVYHGVGLVAWQIFQEIKRKRSKLRTVVNHPYMKPVWVFFTFCYVGFSFLFFSFDLHSIGDILKRIFI